MDVTIRRRRALVLLATGVVITALSLGFGHRGVHAVRSLIVPGAGLYDRRHLLLGISLTLAALVATVAWLRWGMDWSVLAVLVLSMALSAALAYEDHPATAPTVHAAAHEFPLVVLVMGGLSWARLAWRRSPLGRRRAGRAAPRLPVVDQCRTSSLAAIAGDVPTPVDVGVAHRRCRRVGIAARGRVGGDPLRIDHAHVRGALALTGAMDDAAIDRFRRDAAAALTGVPASEPGWVRLLDGTLAAVALQRAGDTEVGEHWTAALAGPFELRHGHRPAACWTPVALRVPRGATWEHAAATGLARAAGWIHADDDWTALRTRSLAAAARGNSVADDERLVAAARIWLRFVDDPQAERILGRVTIATDPIAVALDRVSSALRTRPELLRTAGVPTAVSPIDPPLLEPTRRT